MNERQFLEKFRQSQAGQKLLKTIRFAEGTAGPKGYQTMFGGGTFSDASRHPDKVIRSGGYASAAAGAYQFLPGTWQRQASRLGLKTFGPAEQDVAALALARNRLRDLGGLSVLEKEGLSPRVAAALSPEWASFPTETGRSYYGQPVKSLSALQKVYGQAPQPDAQTAATPGLQQRSVEEILSSVLMGIPKPALEEANEKSGSLLEDVKSSLIRSLIPASLPVFNPL